MNVGVPRETADAEHRVALTPPAARRLQRMDVDVLIERDAGARSYCSDAAYRDAGCEIVESRDAVFDRADVLLQVRALGATPDSPPDPYRSGQTVIGLLGPTAIDPATLNRLADERITAFALELIPRIGRAQSMDVLSSMASIGGYKAAIMAANSLPSLFPLQMTAAGTVRPATVFVIGAGVAGLQAIATARRLGAAVRAYDIRPAVKEEVESLGAEFVDLELAAEQATDLSGYAREQDESFYAAQREMMHSEIADADVVITAAAVPGRRAPTLVTTEMLDGMDPGSVLVDLAADTGGNCEATVPGDRVERAGVTIVGATNLPSRVSRTASQLFANNITAFLENLVEDGELVVDTDDEIVDETLIAHDGTLRHRPTEASADDR